MEHEYSVSPLALPGKSSIRITPGSLLEYASIALFVARAKAVRPEFELTEANAAICGEICRKLDGLPLAIELAAARVRAFPVQTILERLSLKLLNGGSRDLPARQQTLRGAIEWSYDLLTYSEKALFRQLSVFGSGFALEAAEKVCKLESKLALSHLDGIESLIVKNLLQQKEITPTGTQLPYNMLETIREYGLEKLTECGELTSQYATHAAYYTQLIRELEPHLHNEEVVATLKRLDAEYPNLREVLYRSLKTLELSSETGCEIAEKLWWYWRNRGYLSEGRYYLERALVALEVILVAQKARLLNALADLCLRLGLSSEAVGYAEESLVIAHELDDKLAIGSASLTLGWIAACQGEYRVGTTYLVESHNLFCELGDKRGMGISQLNLGWIAHNQGDFGEATRYLKASLDLFRQVGNKWGIGNSLNMLGVVSLNQTNYLTANNYLEEGLYHYREMDYGFGIASLLNNLGLSALCQGEYQVADKYLEESLNLFREIDARQSISNTLENLATTAIEQTHFEEAFEYLQESLLMLEQLNDGRGLLYSMADFMGLQSRYWLRQLEIEGKRPQAVLIYLAHLAGVVEQLSGASNLKLVEQPWLGYYEASLELARGELAAEDFQAAFTKGQSFTLPQIINYALTELKLN